MDKPEAVLTSGLLFMDALHARRMVTARRKPFCIYSTCDFRMGSRAVSIFCLVYCARKVADIIMADKTRLVA